MTIFAQATTRPANHDSGRIPRSSSNELSLAKFFETVRIRGNGEQPFELSIDTQTGMVESITSLGTVVARSHSPFRVNFPIQSSPRRVQFIEAVHASSVKMEGVDLEGRSIPNISTQSRAKTKPSILDVRRLVVTYSDFKSMNEPLKGLVVRVIWESTQQPHDLPKDIPNTGLVTAIAVTNGTQTTLEKIDFPRLEFSGTLGSDGKDDRVFLPRDDGIEFDRQGIERVSEQPSRRTPFWWFYPGPLSMQFASFYDLETGLTMASLDSLGNRKNFFFTAPERDQKKSSTLTLTIQHELRLTPEDVFESPLHLLAPTKGSWQSAATLYRDWALKQHFSNPPVDVPQWLSEYPFLLNVKIRSFLKSQQLDQPVEIDHAAIVETVKKWQRDLGCDVLVDIREWEKSGIYASPFYFPLFPSTQQVRKLNQSLLEINSRTQPMVSGLKWMIYREANKPGSHTPEPVDTRREFETIGREVCVIGSNGDVVVVPEEKAKNWAGEHSEICVGSGYAKKFLPELAAKMAEQGFVVFQIDQQIGGACRICYSNQHGHPVGSGPWIIREFLSRLDEIRRAGKAVNPEFAIGMESCGELLIPYTDIFYGRINRGSHVQPAQGPGTMIVPAFNFVYQQRTSIGIMGHQLTSRSQVGRTISTARAVVAGTRLSGSLGNSKESTSRGPESVHRDQLAMVRLGQKLFNTSGIGSFLKKGYMLNPPVIDVPELSFSEQGEFPSDDYRSPVVLHTKWRSSEGQEAVLLVNVSDQAVRVATDGNWFGPKASHQPPNGGNGVDQQPRQTWIVGTAKTTHAVSSSSVDISHGQHQRFPSELTVPPLGACWVFDAEKAATEESGTSSDELIDEEKSPIANFSETLPTQNREMLSCDREKKGSQSIVDTALATQLSPTTTSDFIEAYLAKPPVPAGLLGQQVKRALARPNVVILLADDLGFSDLGCYGGEIETPVLNQLAANGLRFSQFYNTGRCWPTRASILSGYYPQNILFDNLPRKPVAPRKRPDWSILLPEHLKLAGYRSYHSGKWHIDKTAFTSGFDRSYSLDDHGRYFSPKNHTLDDQPLPQPKLIEDFYTTENTARYAIDFLKDHQQHHQGAPFFLYVGFTAPHFPLHARENDIAKYSEKYNEGWNVIRQRRHSQLRELGLVGGDLSDVEPHVGPPYKFAEALEKFGPDEVAFPLPWLSLNKKQRLYQAKKMEIHAAMVDSLDQSIGLIVEQLKRMEALDNTLILFLSDNGASAELMIRDDGHDPNAIPGSAATHLCLGAGWSNAANSPFRRHKSWVHEGGIRTPLIAHWPAGISVESLGQLRHQPGHVIDLVPTILHLAAIDPSTVKPAAAPLLPGKNLVNVLKHNESVERQWLWWCHNNNRAIRIGDWKLVAAKNNAWELFDLANDPTENHNLAEKHPDKVKELVETWERTASQWEPLHRKLHPPR